jgi:hypothetical protein
MTDLIDFTDLDAVFQLSGRELDEAIEAMSSETIEVLMQQIAQHQGQGVMK